MLIQYCSDLHLEFPQNKKYLRKNPLVPTGDILILAGDIVPFVQMDEHTDFFNYLSDNFEQTFWVPGNHEYYGFDTATKGASFKEAVRTNVLLLNNQVITLKNIALIFSTLWSNIPVDNFLNVVSRLTDFRAIYSSGNFLSPVDYNLLHQQDLNFLIDVLQNNTAAVKMVITHHAPTFLNYPAKYKNDVLNVAFATELKNLIENYEIDYWQYGHHHVNSAEYIIGRTKLITNQLGYIKYKENKGFNNAATINIENV